MSDRASPLPQTAFGGIVRIAEGGLTGMVTLKADLALAGDAVKAATGQDMPAPRRIAGGAMSVAWMAPDEVLILCDHGDADGLVADITARLRHAHHLCVNVSDARALFTLEGTGIKDVLGKLTPADLSDLTHGEMRRTRLAQVPGAIWFSAPDKACVICFRSVAQYMFDLLATAARPGGEVGYH